MESPFANFKFQSPKPSRRGLAIVLVLAATVSGAAADDTAETETPASPAPASDLVSDSPSIDDLNQDAMQEAYRVLQRDFIRKEELDHDELNRSALSGMLDRIGVGARLVRSTDKESDPTVSILVAPIIERFRDNQIAYFRSTFHLGEDDDLMGIGDALATFADERHQPKFLIIDLRADDGSDDFVAAARFLEDLVPAGELMFQIKKPGGDRGTVFQAKDPVVTIPDDLELVFLVDQDTSPAAETVAAYVSEHRPKILIAGATTSGRTVRFGRVSVAEGIQLEYAEAEVILDGGSRPFGTGVSPKLRLASDLDNKRKALAEVADSKSENAVWNSIHTNPRPRFSEAALVAGTKPELPYRIEQTKRAHAEREGRGLPDEQPMPTRDRVLAQLVDYLHARHFLGAPEAPEPDTEEEEATDGKKA